MTSPDEARLILRKWESESVWVYALFAGENELHKFWCKVKLSDENLGLVGTNSMLSVPFADVEAWSYGDPREAPPSIRASMESKFTCALSAQLRGFKFLVLYEGKP